LPPPAGCLVQQCIVQQMNQKCGRTGVGTRDHVANTFKAQGNHFQGLREPFSHPKFHPLHSPANGHQP
jgi:hypothetical protein